MIDWSKPVITESGENPLLSPPNCWGERLGFVNNTGFTWNKEGKAYIAGCRKCEADLKNKPETVKVWLILKNDNGVITGRVQPYGSIMYMPAEYLHGPIEVPIQN